MLGKRSFQLLPKDITEKNLTLFGAINNPTIFDPQQNRIVTPESDGYFKFEFDFNLEYEVITSKTICQLL
jgi:hypothetical protein